MTSDTSRTSGPARRGWFGTILQPGLHLFTTAAMAGAVIVAVALSIAVPAVAGAVNTTIA